MTTQGEGTVQKKRGRPRKTIPPQAVEAALQVAGADIDSGTGTVGEPADPGPPPKGVNSGDLFASEEESELEIVHKGQTWTFRYKDLTWGDKNYCIDQAQIWEGESFRFSVQRYYAAALTRMITSSPIRPITEITLQKLDRAVGE